MNILLKLTNVKLIKKKMTRLLFIITALLSSSIIFAGDEIKGYV